MAFELIRGFPLVRRRTSRELTGFQPIDFLGFLENKGIWVCMCEHGHDIP